MEHPVGYLIKRENRLTGDPGIGYNYVMAGNGLHVQSENSHIQACIPLGSRTKIKGLPPMERRIHLVHGPIPRGIFAAGLHWFRETPETERFFAVLWEEDRYKIAVPHQDGTGSRLEYQLPGPGVVMEIHSHGIHGAFFSGTDNQDEQGFRVYGVIGRVGNDVPHATLRIGIYGHFANVQWNEIFDGGKPPLKFTGDDNILLQ